MTTTVYIVVSVVIFVINVVSTR